MTEHVCEIKQDYPGIPYEHREFSGTVERRERVVRCKNCASYRPGHGVNFKPRCEKSIGTFVPEPDGFCAWGRSVGVDD